MAFFSYNPISKFYSGASFLLTPSEWDHGLLAQSPSVAFANGCRLMGMMLQSGGMALMAYICGVELTGAGQN